jgi:hypothetical protein
MSGRPRFRSNFLAMERYRIGNTYAYDLKAARDHVVWYHEMMDLLADRLPAIVRVIHYEALIADPAAALRAVADLCGVTMATGRSRHSAMIVSARCLIGVLWAPEKGPRFRRARKFWG